MIGHYGRYLAGWAIAGAMLALALLFVFPGVAGDSGAAAAVAGVLVAGITDLFVFAIVLRALAADAKGFPKLWGLSVLVKITVLGSAIALVAARGWFPVDGFVRVLICAFVVFAHHEIFWLIRMTRKRGGVQAC